MDRFQPHNGGKSHVVRRFFQRFADTISLISFPHRRHLVVVRVANITREVEQAVFKPRCRFAESSVHVSGLRTIRGIKQTVSVIYLCNVLITLTKRVK